MKEYKATGYILSRRNLKDSDRIITIFTLEYGKISLIAKGIKKPKAKLQSQLEPLAEVRFRYLGSGAIPILVGAQALSANQYFSVDMDRRISALFISEIMDLISIEGQPNKELYSLYKTCLLDLLETKKVLLSVVYSMINIMKLSGIEPSIDNLKDNSSAYFDYDDGTVSSQIGGNKASRVSIESAKLWMICLKYHKRTVDNLAVDQLVLNESFMVLSEYFQYHYAKRLKSIKVLINSTNLLQPSA